jgi:hypothetical protein
MRSRGLIAAAAVASTLLAVGCSAASDESANGEEDDLTSLTARQRKLTFEGVVYVGPDATDEQILDAAHAQTQTAFGALLNAKVSVRTREVQNLTAASLVKRKVTVVDTSRPGDPGVPALEVRYRYGDDAIVPVELSRHTTLSLALVAKGSEGEHVHGVVEACTKNDKEAREDADGGLLWYDFDPGRASCRREIEREQRMIDDDTAKLADKKTQVAKSRVNRTYLPTTMSLARASTATKATYPEYDKLFAGGVAEGALVVALVNGRLAHDRTEAVKDDGYYEWMDALGVVFDAHPDFELVKTEPAVDVTTATVAGKKITNLSFKDFVRWTVYGDGWPAGVAAADRGALAKQIADKLDGKWLTFEKKVKVRIGAAPPKDFALRIVTQFGADEDPTPHREAVKRGDVVLYNGHSYIGYGPLDPANFRPSSFPSTYQLFFFDSCVSYNYYEKDFFTLKPGGSGALDMITNGLEAPEYRSGEAQGKFIAKLFDGSMPSYQTLLEAAKATDSMRVVDGEIDNRYHPSRVDVRILPR